MKTVMAAAVVLMLVACSPSESNTQARRDAVYLTGVSSACLLEIEKRELSRFSSAGLPETTELPVLLSPLAEGTELRLHLEYRLPDVPGPNQFNEADCTVNGGSVVKLILKH